MLRNQRKVLRLGVSSVVTLALVISGIYMFGPEADDDCPGTGFSDTVLWEADAEEGNLHDWTYENSSRAGGGSFPTGNEEESIVRATSTIAHSGSFAYEATINGAYRGENGAKAVRLMRWTDRPWARFPLLDGGKCFPEDAYYSVWMYFPVTYNTNKYDPWRGELQDWWNVFQFKSADVENVSQPVWTMNVHHDDEAQQMYFQLFSKENGWVATEQNNRVSIPVGEWVHVEARYVQSETTGGSITIWQNGFEIMRAEDVITVLENRVVWGIGNYTDHIVGGPVAGSATIYFDDAQVSTQRVGIE